MPIAFYLPAILLLWTFPLTPHVQKRIRTLVEWRARRTARKQAPSAS
jgi:hypothetical protein